MYQKWFGIAVKQVVTFWKENESFSIRHQAKIYFSAYLCFITFLVEVFISLRNWFHMNSECSDNILQNPSVSAFFWLLMFVFLPFSDFSPQVNFYWRRGQRIIPKGHRRGHLEPQRFQIDDHPHSQIRITQQLPQVEVALTPEVNDGNTHTNLRWCSLWL